MPKAFTELIPGGKNERNLVDKSLQKELNMLIRLWWKMIKTVVCFLDGCGKYISTLVFI